MALAAFGLARTRSLYAAVMFASIYSLLAAAMFVVLDAVDVAFTEAAVGAGVSTVLALATLAVVPAGERERYRMPWLALAVVAVAGAILIYATLDLPYYGDANAVANRHIVPTYLAEAPKTTGVPNVVTAVLAAYRGYDTLGETTVIFTAGLGVVLLLGGWRRTPRKGGDDA
jgi:multicomponent Na+:H+ antiporter subunit B